MTDSNENTPPTGGFVLPAKYYEFVKWFVLIFLPGLSSFYYGLSLIWEGVPAAGQVVGTLALLATFLGLILGVSNRNFKAQGADGYLNAAIDGDNVVFSRIALPNITAEELTRKKSVTIQVNPTFGASQ